MQFFKTENLSTKQDILVCTFLHGVPPQSMAGGVIRGLEPQLLQNQFWSKERFYTHCLSLEVKQSCIVFEQSHVAIRLIFWIIGSISKSEWKKEIEILVLLL